MAEQDSTHLIRADSNALTGNKPRIVILGAGFGGLYAAQRLAGVDAEVVVVDKQNHHLFQPLLYQVATAGLSPGDIASPIRSVLRKQDNAQIFLAEAEEIDRDNKIVQLDTGRLAYDYLVVATGAQTQYFGPDRWEENSTPLKTIEDAVELRREILYAFERAEQVDDPEVIEEWLTFAIIGGGPTGVEMAGAIREIAAEVMIHDFRTIRPEEANVVLIDAAPRILGTYPEELSEEAQRELEERDVRVLTDSPVQDVTETSVTANDETIPTRTVVWAAGVEPVPLIGTLETEYDDQGRAVVTEELHLKEDDSVFVIGDAARFEHYGEEPLPGLAPVAIQQGKFAADNIERALDGEEIESFHYWDRGEMATIGRHAAVAVVGDWKLSGYFAWLAWLFIHLLFLVGFRNKLTVLLEWAYSYVIFKRSARLIVGEPDTRRRLPAAEEEAIEAQAASPDESTDEEALGEKEEEPLNEEQVAE